MPLPQISDYHHLKASEMKQVEFANSTDTDEVAHNEPPHLGALVAQWVKRWPTDLAD